MQNRKIPSTSWLTGIEIGAITERKQNLLSEQKICI